MTTEGSLEVLTERGVEGAGLLVVLGSGQKNPWQEQVLAEVPYTDLPGWERPGVEGHGGLLSVFRAGGENVLVMAGRHHYYESRSYDGVLRPLETARALGVRLVLLTNSAGALDPTLQAGDLVLVSDHLFLQGPDLSGRLHRRGQLGRRGTYSRRGRPIMKLAAARCSIELSEGVLSCVAGPTYETVAEAGMLRGAGARVAAMSLAPEALAAWSMGMDVVGLSVVTNVIGPTGDGVLDHTEVVAAASKAQPGLNRLLSEAVPMLLA